MKNNSTKLRLFLLFVCLFQFCLIAFSLALPDSREKPFYLMPEKHFFPDKKDYENTGIKPVTVIIPAPTNDNCSNAVVLTSFTTCTNGIYTLDQSTPSVGVPAGCAPLGTHYDVWFSFIAASVTQTVTVSGFDVNTTITNPALELFSGSCGALTSIQCGSTGITAAGLTIGNTYYLRFSNIGSDPSGNGNKPKFSICVTHPLPLSLTRGPYLNMGGQTSLTIRWRTNIASDSKVELGTSLGTYPIVVTDATLTTEHIVNVTGLTEDTKYYYRIGSITESLQGSSSNFFTTLPATNTTRKIRIAAFGDCGRNDNSFQTQTLAQYQSYLSANSIEAPDALILLGDNAYTNGTDAEYTSNFFNAYSSNILKNHKIYPSQGNHDYYGTSQTSRAGAYYQNFTMPTAGELGGQPSGTEAYYSFDIGNIHFMALDAYGLENSGTTRMYDTTGAQVTWIKQDIAANTKKWTIAYWHHPPYTMGSHTSDAESELVNIRENFIRILERNGVDLIINGHSHDYERSYLLKGYYKVNPGDAAIMEAGFNAGLHTVTTSSGKYNGTSNSCPYVYNSGKYNHGTVYVVAGSSGADGGVQAGYPHNALPWSIDDGGMFYFEIDGNRLDAKFIQRTGAVGDQFTILKDVNTTSNYNITLGQSINLTASWPGTYVWDNNATTQTRTVTPSSIGTFNYSVVDASGRTCLTDNFSVVVSGTLAVHLNYFSAVSDRDKVLLEWETFSETDSKEFLLEHATDGRSFKMFEKIKANGNSTQRQKYYAAHLQPVTGVNYYRLAEIDNDGNKEYFEIKKVVFSPVGNKEIIVAADAKAGIVPIKIISNEKTSAVFNITDIHGRIIRENNIVIARGVSEQKVQLNAGFYFISIKTYDGEKIIKKVCVN